MLPDLSNKEIDIQNLAQQAIQDEALLSHLLKGLKSKKNIIRFNSFETLKLLTEQHPERLYPEWGFLVDFLDSENNFHKYIAIYLLANLTKADTEGKFERLFDKFCSQLDGDSMMTAGHVVINLGKIIKTKPALKTKILNVLFAVDETSHTQSHKELIKAYVIDVFENYFDEIEEKEKIVEFVKNQLNSESLKTRNKAKEFLQKFSG